ncbi:MAG TPA: hypothetical protein V6D22_08115 [Candidatus Obscuribacterales bacterium]
MRPRLSRAAFKNAIIIGASFAAGMSVMALSGHLSSGSTKQAAAAESTREASSGVAEMPAQSVECGNQRIPAPPPPVAAAGGVQEEAAGSSISPTMSIPGRQLDYGQTASGYPIATGRKAVDYYDSAQGRVINTGVDPGATAGWAADDYSVPAQRLGRNGLVSNPCVDPPSSHGAAYSRAY